MNASVALRLYLASRSRAGGRVRRSLAGTTASDDAVHSAQRDGHTSAARPAGPLVWFHTGGDAEAAAARELAARLRQERDDLNLLFTCTPPPAWPSAPPMLAQCAPDEALPAIRRFLSHWRPDVSVWTEPDMRPALAHETAEAGIPMLFVDAATAPPELHKLPLWPSAAATLFSRFERLVIADADAAPGFRRLGAPASGIEPLGALREGPAALPCNRGERDALAALLSGRPAWLAAQVAADEVAPVIEAHLQAIRRTHRLLLLLVPADPAAGPTMAEDLRGRDLVAALRSAGEEPEAHTQVYIADTEGELGLWYRLAPLSFLGGTFASGCEAANPMHAAALGSAILHGPNTRPHEDAFRCLGQAGAVRRIDTAPALAQAVETLLSPDVAATMAHAAWQVSTAGAEVTDRAADLILGALDARGV